LQKTAEVRKSRKSGSDDDFGIEELISGEGGGFGMSITMKNEIGFRRQLTLLKLSIFILLVNKSDSMTSVHLLEIHQGKENTVDMRSREQGG
jgi:hypothetical protein